MSRYLDFIRQAEADMERGEGAEAAGLLADAAMYYQWASGLYEQASAEVDSPGLKAACLNDSINARMRASAVLL